MQQAKILVVEDRREVLDVLQRTLTDNGFDVITAADGDSGTSDFRKEMGWRSPASCERVPSRRRS
jgi:DNA-binding response OmpR family regulator